MTDKPTGRERSLRDLRVDYRHGQLTRSHIPENPLQLFASWFEAAEQENSIREPNAMVVSTVTAAGFPDARIVLLKELRDEGFAFFSNYESAKGEQLTHTPAAALIFYWEALERQVRVRGAVERLAAEESDAYFRERPRDSQLAAHASQQSRVLARRAELDERYAEAEARFPGDVEVPRPASWGGYLVRPEVLEFWQGRPSRLHDRLVYKRNDNGWDVERLSP